MTQRTELIEERAPSIAVDPGTTWRLGRHIEHDETSKAFPAARATALVSVEHHRRSKPFDQGNLGSCTGNAMAGVLDTVPFTHSHLGERTAINLYEHATVLDDIPGSYPPDDTGSSGLAVCKAAQQLKLISAYHHAFGLQHALEALVVAPVIIGIDWYDSFDSPEADGELVISPNAQVRGGHEIEVNRIDVENQMIGGYNSWGSGWGPLHGQWIMSWATFDDVLGNSGDVTVPIP